MTRQEKGTAWLMIIVLWSVLIFDSLCYGRGWCRIRTDEYGPKGPLDGEMMFKWGGWEQ